jgi:hypothetical protein
MAAEGVERRAGHKKSTPPQRVVLPPTELVRDLFERAPTAIDAARLETEGPPGDLVITVRAQLRRLTSKI